VKLLIFQYFFHYIFLSLQNDNPLFMKKKMVTGNKLLYLDGVHTLLRSLKPNNIKGKTSSG